MNYINKKILNTKTRININWINCIVNSMQINSMMEKLQVHLSSIFLICSIKAKPCQSQQFQKKR